MTESTRKPSAQRQESTQTRREQNRRQSSRQTASRRGAVVKAVLSGASPEQLSGLLGRDGAGIPNSVLLDLLSRERPLVDRDPRPLPFRPAETEPFVWDGPFGAMEDGAVEALPVTPFPADAGFAGGGTLEADAGFTRGGAFSEVSAFPANAGFTTEGGSLGGAGGPGAAGSVSG